MTIENTLLMMLANAKREYRYQIDLIRDIAMLAKSDVSEELDTDFLAQEVEALRKTIRKAKRR